MQKKKIIENYIKFAAIFHMSANIMNLLNIQDMALPAAALSITMVLVDSFNVINSILFTQQKADLKSSAIGV